MQCSAGWRAGPELASGPLDPVSTVQHCPTPAWDCLASTLHTTGPVSPNHHHLPLTIYTYHLYHSHEEHHTLLWTWTKKIKNFKFILKYKHFWYYLVEPNLMPSKFLWLHSLSMFHKFWWLQMSDTESEHLTASFDASRPRYRHWSLQTAHMCQSSA